MHEVKLLPHQWDALHSKIKHTVLLGGIGSGKSWCGAHWCINKKFTHPESLGFIGATTYGQLRDATMPVVFNELNKLEIPFSYNQSSGILDMSGKRVLCKGLDNYDALRGIEIGEMWLDECAYIKREAFDVMVGRLRDKRGALDSLGTTTPKGFNWMFDYFHPSGELHDPKWFCHIKAKTADNKHLPDGYIASLMDQYDQKLYQQELEGEFINVTQGRVYYAFDRTIHVQEIKDDGKSTLYVGMDFNVHPMTAVVFQFYDNTFYIIDEFYLENSNTPEMCRELVRKYGEGLSIIPDSTSDKRSTSVTTDFEIIRGHNLNLLSTHNPYVMDRVNNANRLFEQNRVIINPCCKKTINDLEKVSWKTGKNEIDGISDKMLTHISDALTYGLWKLAPLKRPTGGFSIGSSQ
jgi:PBSX family phage terminase large subunit